MLKPFEAAAAKTARARRHLQELKSEIDGFFRSGGASVVYEMAEEYCVKIPGTAAFTYRQSKPVPLEWSAIIGDILHNLRSSLDLVACDVHLISGGKPKDTDNVHYPFCHTKAELPEMIRRRRLSHIGSESRSIIESTAPYRGGNEGLKLDFVRNLGSPSAGTAPREVSQLIAWRGLACPAWRACVA